MYMGSQKPLVIGDMSYEWELHQKHISDGPNFIFPLGGS